MFSYFYSDTAFAQAAQSTAQQPSIIEMLALPAVFVFIMYFLIIRPQTKKQKALQSLLSNLKVGDEVITSGGIIGKIKSMMESFVTIEVSSNVNIKIVKGHIVALTDKNQGKTKDEKQL